MTIIIQGMTFISASSNGYVYTEVCGRITGYQYGNPDAGLGISHLTPRDESAIS